MMKSPTRILKIKLDPAVIDEYDVEEVSRWEGEGGAPGESPVPVSSPSLPLHKNDTFKVKHCDVTVENGRVYLQAEIEPVHLQEED